jgi:hypothetical protein
MKFIRLVFKPVLYFACICMMVLAFAASPAFADNCGTSDRVALPACFLATAGVNGRVTSWNLRNDCSHPVTVKFDARGASDKRETIDADGIRALEVSYLTGPAFDLEGVKIYCCPRYNSCSNG